MAPFFPRGAHDKSIETWERIGAHKGPLPAAKVVHGHPITTKIKAVCRTCNNGWMSQVEQRAQPFIEPMISGRNVVLDATAQLAVTEWIILKIMVWECSQPEETRVYGRDQTLEFAQTRQIAGNVQIWLLRWAGTPRRAHITRAFTGLFLPSEVATADTRRANTQTVLFRAGRFLFYAVHTLRPDFKLREFRQIEAKVLWPSRGPRLVWPPLKSIGSVEMRHIAYTLQRFLDRPGMNPI